MGVSESTVARLKSDHLANFCDLLVALDLKVVPQAVKCFDPASISALMQLARERVAQMDAPDVLEWD